MKGSFTFLWLLLVAGVCFGLFLAKYKVQALETELAALNQVILERQEELHVLKAEWAHLSRPDRIQRLSERYLTLKPMASGRIGTQAELHNRLEKSE
ncbi:MAG: cell division protein FtsL [Alphaproteobacteria bacterium]